MKRLSFLYALSAIGLLLFSGAALADAGPPEESSVEEQGCYRLGTYQSGADTYALSDLPVYHAPAFGGTGEFSLPAGTPIKILEEPDTGDYRGDARNRWYKVSFQKTVFPPGTLSLQSGLTVKDGQVEAYTLGRFLATAFLEVPLPNVAGKALILAGYDPNAPDPSEDAFSGNRGLLTILQADGSVVAQTDFHPAGLLAETSASLTVENSEGFDPPLQIIRFHLEQGACGIPGGDNLFAWDGVKLHHIFEAPKVSEAGVFHDESRFLLPGERRLLTPSDKNWQPNVIELLHRQETYDEAKQDYVPVREERKTYTWTRDKADAGNNGQFKASRWTTLKRPKP